MNSKKGGGHIPFTNLVELFGSLCMCWRANKYKANHTKTKRD